MTRAWPPHTPHWRLAWNRLRNKISPCRHLANARYFIQRGRRGYSDADVWSLHCYLSDLLVGALTQLSEHSHGYPAAITAEEWQVYLDIMIAGFKAAKGLSDCHYMIEQPDGSYKYDEALEQDMIRTHRRGIAKFAIWFLDLWD